MRSTPQATSARHLCGLILLAIICATTANSAQQVAPFDPRFEGQLFGVRTQMQTQGLPGGVVFVNGRLYVADAGNFDEDGSYVLDGGVTVFDSAGDEVAMPDADWAVGNAQDPESPAFGLIPNQLAAVPLRLSRASGTVDITAILVSDSSVDRVLAFDTNGSYLFTMWLPYPEATISYGVTTYVDSTIPVINGMSMAPGARFVYNEVTSSLAVQGAFAAGWSPDFGLFAGATLVYRNQTFLFDGANGWFTVAPQVSLSTGRGDGNTVREPMGVAFDSAGNLFVIDTVTEFLHAYSPSFSLLFDFGTPALGGTAAEFHEPYAIAFWPDVDPDGSGLLVAGPGRLFVADQINNRILAYRPDIANLTLDYLFTIEGFTIDGLDDAQPYSLAVDPATGRIATSDGSGETTRVWILQTRQLVAYNLEVLDADGAVSETVCSGQPYSIRFFLTVPAGWPELANVLPQLFVDGVVQSSGAAATNLMPAAALSYTFDMVAPGSASEPFVGDLPLLAAGSSTSTTDVLPRRGVVRVVDCAASNAPPQITITPSAPAQRGGWTAVSTQLTTPFSATLSATDDTTVTEIEYEVLDANDDPTQGEVRVANPAPGAASQALTIPLREVGLTTIRFRARDDRGVSSAWQTRQLFLVEVPERSTNENQAVSFTPWTPVFGGPAVAGMTYSATSLPPGTTMNAQGLVSGTPNFSSAGDYTVQVTERNASGQTSTFTFTWRVANVNRPPVANADTFTVNEDAVLNGNVLTNDSDPDGNALTATLVSDVTRGALVFNQNGTFTYTPAAGINGTDSFSYRATDGVATTGTVTVSLTIAAVNDAPSFTAGASQTVNEDAAAQSIAGWATNLSAGPANESAQTLSFVVTNSNTALFSQQPAVSAAGTLTYQLAPNRNGSAVVTVSLRDSGGTANGGTDTSAPQTFTITVNPVDDPPAVIADSYSIATTGVLNVPAPGVLGNDTDPDGTALTATLVSTVSSGTLTLNPNGSFIYTPASGFTGTTSFTYRAGDGTSTSAIATVTLTVTGGNRPPVCTAATVSPSVIWPPNHKPVYVSIGGITDPDGGTPTIRFTGILQDEPTQTTGDGNTTQDAAIEQSGAKAWVRAERSGNFDGRVYLVSFKATDSAGASCTGELRVAVPHSNNTAAVLSPGRWNSITGALVTPPPAPNAVDDVATVAKGKHKSIDVLGNDAASGLTLTVSLVGQPSKGSAKVNSDGSITYTAPSNTTGTTTLTYKVSNGFGGTDTAKVTITIVKSSSGHDDHDRDDCDDRDRHGRDRDDRDHDRDGDRDHDRDEDCGDDRHDHRNDWDGRERDHGRGNHDRCNHRR